MSSKEHRRSPRRKVAETVLVSDVMTEEVVGRIGNLSETGMLLIANLPLNDDALYQLRFPLRDEGGHEHQREQHGEQVDPAHGERAYRIDLGA